MRYRWYILGLSVVTNILVIAVPSMGLPVLFSEITRELHLDLVQVGVIWGLGSLPGIATGLLAGILGDRFQPKHVLAFGCLAIGLTGALRALASDFTALAASVFLMGFFFPFVSMNTVKSCGLWFSSRQLGLATGALSMGMALGFLLGSLLSATVLSPWLGGWRNVLICFGAIAVLFSLPWLLVRRAPSPLHLPSNTPSLRLSIGLVLRNRNVWLLGLAMLGMSGCVQGALGYLPLYLRGQGWPAARADAALASFHTISLVCTIPIALVSDRLRSRRGVLLATSAQIMLGIGLLAVAAGPLVWAAVLLAGMARDGFMAVFMTSVIETDGIGPAYAGTALGLVMAFSGIGMLISPPLGNSLAALAPSLPFAFWAGLLGLGMLGLAAMRQKPIHQVVS